MPGAENSSLLFLVQSSGLYPSFFRITKFNVAITQKLVNFRYPLPGSPPSYLIALQIDLYQPLSANSDHSLVSFSTIQSSNGLRAGCTRTRSVSDPTFRSIGSVSSRESFTRSGIGFRPNRYISRPGRERDEGCQDPERVGLSI